MILAKRSEIGWLNLSFIYTCSGCIKPPQKRRHLFTLLFPVLSGRYPSSSWANRFASLGEGASEGDISVTPLFRIKRWVVRGCRCWRYESMY